MALLAPVLPCSELVVCLCTPPLGCPSPLCPCPSSTASSARDEVALLALVWQQTHRSADALLVEGSGDLCSS